MLYEVITVAETAFERGGVVLCSFVAGVPVETDQTVAGQVPERAVAARLPGIGPDRPGDERSADPPYLAAQGRRGLPWESAPRSCSGDTAQRRPTHSIS